MLPKINYHHHKDTAEEIISFFPGLKKEDLPGGEGWAMETITVSTHNGTHMDAPYHYHSTMDNGNRAITIDEVPLEWCYGKGVKFDFRSFSDGYVVNVDDIKKELDKKLSKTKNIILAGELYSLTKERERYGDTISGLGDKSKRKNLRLGVFDVVISDKLLSSFEEKYKFLKKNLNENSKDLSHVLEHKQIKHSDVNKHFKEIVIKNNAEGLIVRNDSAVYKIKKEETSDLLITGYTLGLSLIHI